MGTGFDVVDVGVAFGTVSFVASELRTDLVTGLVSLHVPSSDKPRPVLKRHEPNTPGECPLCRVHAHVKSSGALGFFDSAVAVPNKFPVLTEDSDGLAGECELVFTGSHVLSAEDLPQAEFVSLLTMSQYRAWALEGSWRRVAGFMNVGVEAGASLTHLHAQVIGADHSELPRELDPYDTALGCKVCTCREVARKRNLLVSEHAWVPYAPSGPFEVRIAGDCHDRVDWADLAVEAHRILRRWKDSRRMWAYNLLLHRKPHPWIQILPRTDFGLGYPRLVGAMVVGVDEEAYAVELRQDQ